ncbi:MAG: hypothetical protein A2563_02495 [Candidatus Magasanikbacteria bacterium RIFOXYD1_FULL_40_23]|uniref:Uncharacterized protein n=1 Tax=Candidatus Magasanikbacteria bacterium RIFOXYD1_FULL_40_23 TaxID=1798705 RepID=A0A1F6P9B8_9BACT|nr:MAG: hypothetical protein A2563_02495 [Candidatus Magasanikbacteria bacterium RIFOXYD1_FULL_40_23]
MKFKFVCRKATLAIRALCRQSDLFGVTTRSSCAMGLDQLPSEICCLVGSAVDVAVVLFFLGRGGAGGRRGGALHLSDSRSRLDDGGHGARIVGCLHGRVRGIVHGFERVQLACG